VIDVKPTDSATPAQRLAQHRRHVRLIRRRVAGLAAGTFLATTGGILVQLVTGHDPALAHSGSSASKASVAVTSTTTSGSSSSAAVAGQPTRTAVTSSPSPITTSAS
jgi:hypothetical protein